MSRKDPDLRNSLRPDEALDRLIPSGLSLPGHPEYGFEDTTIPEYPERPRGDRVITAVERDNIASVLAELAARRKESLKLYVPTQVADEFHRSRAGIRIVRGGNRGGKTLMAAAEFARRWTGQDPYGKAPARGRAILVGKDLLHCSKVMYRKLFKPGAFRIIKDHVTGRWRTFNPATDLGRESETRESPPLIPQRFYDPKRDVSWENKKEEIPRTIKLRTGWEVTLFSGEGEPPQGWDVDDIWFDEEIPHSKWLTEMLPRLVDRNGILVWSATPQAGTVQLYELSAKAEEQKEDPNPRVQEFFVNIFTNPFLSQEVKDKFVADFADDEEETRVRIHGDFAIHGQRIYPEIQITGHHRFPSQPIPSHWTRYLAIDPGRQVTAVLFAAVPDSRSEYSGQAVFYDECYIKKANAAIVAKAIADKIGDHYVQGWLIDYHEARKVETACGRSIEEQYAEAFIRENLEERGFRGFIHASDDVDAGILAFRRGLHLHDGRPMWLFDPEKLKWFKWETERYVYQKVAKTGVVLDRPLKKNDHLMDCARYLAMHSLRYVRPPAHKPRSSKLLDYVEKKKARSRNRDGWGTSVRLG